MTSNHIVKPRSSSGIQHSIQRYLKYHLGRERIDASTAEIYRAAALAVREYMIDAMLETEKRYRAGEVKRLYYLSMEYLIGRSLGNNLINLDLFELFRDALQQWGIDIEEVRECEKDAALGNGGLGRLAACFMDSMATLGMPGFGYGINYDYGLFRQHIFKGYQQERPDSWSREDSPWLIERGEEIVLVPINGRVEVISDGAGNTVPIWLDWKLLIGTPHDMPIVGYGGETVNYLRLYSARSSDEFDMSIFNSGDYIRAVEQKIISESVSKVLYPSDSVDSGKELRLTQEYFMVACALRDICRQFSLAHGDFSKFSEKVAIQLNDTHPALAVAELMRLFLDEHRFSWETSWKLTTETLAYTNHTLLPEALEKWPVDLLEKLLPRHMQIIYDINERLLESVEKRWPGDKDRARDMSIIDEEGQRNVRMAYLSIVGSHSVNGVAALHSELVKSSLVPDFYELTPEKFNNKTNGITQRRWLLKSNPALSALITETIGDRWITDLPQLRKLESHAADEVFQSRFRQIKRGNKNRLGRLVHKVLGIKVNPDALFDVQIKRIHEYKRQLLNMMHIIHLYLSIVEDGLTLETPRVCLLAGKAAPGYWEAKQIIKLINSISELINKDTRSNEQLQVVFLPDYRVSLAEKIFPAADLSEQISTAGMEASGTGNMKFALNGALTIGTLDGANIEIRDEVGEENIFIFGHTAAEIAALEESQTYSPVEVYRDNPRVRRIMDSIRSNRFCPREPGLFRWIFEQVVERHDPYFHLADLASYLDTHAAASKLYTEPFTWTEKTILNVARSGKFSSDRTISEYAKEIWNIPPAAAG